MTNPYKATVFICSHQRGVARDDHGHWCHLLPDDLVVSKIGQLGSICEAGIYKHTIGPGDLVTRNTVMKAVV